MIYGIWTFLTVAFAFVLSAAIGKFLIPYLRKLHFGQTILEIGPKWHMGKQGTPTMGGIMFIISILVVTVISTVLYIFFGDKLINIYFADIPREAVFIFAGLGLAVANGFIGFIDDYTKVVKKRNLGLTAIQKLVLQFAAAALFLLVLGLLGYGTTTTIPFVGKVDLGFFYYII
ncbi:MAG: phospho-N-acetylmuramoyl-pentapeptide-transferase, partial [Clostridia bacterium]|nr:phospho-N-acetylmuramoyl-pentapeptide-transferase [Clostridia bacterium]